MRVCVRVCVCARAIVTECTQHPHYTRSIWGVRAQGRGGMGYRRGGFEARVTGQGDGDQGMMVMVMVAKGMVGWATGEVGSRQGSQAKGRAMEKKCSSTARQPLLRQDAAASAAHPRAPSSMRPTGAEGRSSHVRLMLNRGHTSPPRPRHERALPTMGSQNTPPSLPLCTSRCGPLTCKGGRPSRQGARECGREEGQGSRQAVRITTLGLVAWGAPLAAGSCLPHQGALCLGGTQATCAHHCSVDQPSSCR